MKDIGILKLLCETAGVTGHEKNIATIIKNIFEKYCSEVVMDSFCNVIGIMKAKVYSTTQDKPLKLMITAHMDEIGMMVTGIEEKGFLRFNKISGADPKTLISKKVMIHGKNGAIKGIVASIPPHLSQKEDRKNAPMFDELYIDTGMSDEKLKEIISIGDVISYAPSFEIHGDNIISSKSIDNRIGVFAIIKLMQILKERSFSSDVIFLASVSEEFNSMGALVGSYNIEPDIAIVIDCTHGKSGIVDVIDDKQIFTLGKGPVICKSPILSSRLTENIIDICVHNGLKPLIEIDNKDTGTDALDVSVASKGCAVSLISIPVKYMHTQVEMADLQDVEMAVKIMEQFILQNSVDIRRYICY